MPLASVWAYTYDGVYLAATRTRIMRNTVMASFVLFLALLYTLMPLFGNAGLWIAVMGFLAGRGVLHLSVLIETMRREGYELQVSRPQVVTQRIDGQLHEPIELAVIDVPDQFIGVVTEAMGRRKGTMAKMNPPPIIPGARAEANSHSMMTLNEFLQLSS